MRSCEWEGRAACRGHDANAEDWFPERKQRRWRQTVARAMAVCQTCPVRPQCALKALELGVRDGIWGGVLMMPHVTTRQGELLGLCTVAGADPAQLADLISGKGRRTA